MYTGPSISIAGVRMDLCYTESAVPLIDAMIAEGRGTAPVCFLNAHCVNVAQRDQAYRRALNSAALVLNDGSGVRIAARLQGVEIKENMCGTDFIPALLNHAADRGYTVYLLGGMPGVADRAAEKLQAQLPLLRIVGTRDGYFTAAEEPAVIRAIAAAQPDILIVAMGVPRQEKWIQVHGAALGAKVAIGVGALLDFISGRVPRAPAWMRSVGLEWVYRFLLEPKRMFTRYIVGNPVFLARAWRSRHSHN